MACGDSREEAQPAATDAKATQKPAQKCDLDGDPSDIELFSDPAADVITDAHLVAYLLPGMSAPGADCVEAAIDRQAILDVEIKTGAAAAAKVATDCVTDDSFGKVIAMYAVGFSDEGASHYADIEPCVADEFSELTASQRHDVLQSIFQARLDLAGPLTSPDIAADAVARLIPCRTAAGTRRTRRRLHRPDRGPSAGRSCKRAIACPSSPRVRSPRSPSWTAVFPTPQAR